MKGEKGSLVGRWYRRERSEQPLAHQQVGIGWRNESRIEARWGEARHVRTLTQPRLKWLFSERGWSDRISSLVHTRYRLFLTFLKPGYPASWLTNLDETRRE